MVYLGFGGLGFKGLGNKIGTPDLETLGLC